MGQQLSLTKLGNISSTLFQILYYFHFFYLSFV